MRWIQALGAKVEKQFLVLGANKDEIKKTFRGRFYSLISGIKIGRERNGFLYAGKA